MTLLATTRTPYEIWERILLYAITITESPVLEVACTPSNYLAFKRTCGDGESSAFRNTYYASENDRRSLRLVCRSWRDFADRWDVRERWMRISSFERDVTPDERWRGAQRVEFPSARGIDRVSWLPVETRKLCAVLFTWRTLGMDAVHGGGMRLTRLELLGVLEVAFDTVFKSLCDAAMALKCLRSLSLTISNRGGWPLRKISKYFPELLHLTLRTRFAHVVEEEEENEFLQEEETSEDRWDSYTKPVRYVDALRLKHLEVLFLLPRPGLFRLSSWYLPALQTVHVQNLRADGMWAYKISPFLRRHALTIETLDLDDVEEIQPDGTSIGNPSSSPSPFDPRKVDFWGIFPQLRLLRCSLNQGEFETYPIDGEHPFEYLINTNPTNSASEVADLVRPWVEGTRVKKLEGLVLFGGWFSSGGHLKDAGPVRWLLKQLQWNGTRVMNPAGKLWLDML